MLVIPKRFRNWAIGFVALFLVAWIPPSVLGAVVTSSTIEVLTPFTGTVQAVSQPKPPGQMGFDLGTNTFRYTQSGVQFFRSGGNMTIGLPSFTTKTTSKNTTLIEYSMSSINLNVKYDIKNDTNQYNRNIIISGTSVGTQTLSIPLLNPNNLKITECNLNNNAPASCAGIKNQVCYGSMCLNFGDMPGFTFNNQTNTITGSVTGSFLFDPLAQDGTAGFGSSPRSVTTSASPDVIIVQLTNTAETGKTCGTTSETVTSSHLTFSCRQVETDGATIFEVQEWYAIASGTLTAESVSCSSCAYLTVWAVSGANTVSPFDSLMPTATNGNPNGCSVTGGTSNANDMILWYCDANSGTYSQVTTPSSFTSVAGGFSNLAQYYITSITYSGQVFANGGTLGSGWAVILDAIKQASATTVTQTIKINTVTAGAPSGTITITGCSPSNSTFTANGNIKHYSLTASCSVTLTTSGTSGNTRYEWNVSPKPTISTTLTFTTCSSGTCSEYDNSTYYQLQNTYQVTPVGPTIWGAAYAVSASGTFLGTSNNLQSIGTTTTTGGAISASLWYDYNLVVTLPSAIGSFSPFPATSNLFTQTTGGNTDNTNYAITSSGGSGINLDWLILLPVIVLMLLVALKRR